ncbi:hypothetical protein SDC9_42881 [bioreactor metagenome]|uniref:Uncharacterized protein n=1 Tax=bioreactor metagenome TaxID=1076179 RepID=A0A644VZ47_9ZZZZ
MRRRPHPHGHVAHSGHQVAVEVARKRPAARHRHVLGQGEAKALHQPALHLAKIRGHVDHLARGGVDLEVEHPHRAAHPADRDTGKGDAIGEDEARIAGAVVAFREGEEGLGALRGELGKGEGGAVVAALGLDPARHDAQPVRGQAKPQGGLREDLLGQHWRRLFSAAPNDIAAARGGGRAAVGGGAGVAEDHLDVGACAVQPLGHRGMDRGDHALADLVEPGEDADLAAFEPHFEPRLVGRDRAKPVALIVQRDAGAGNLVGARGGGRPQVRGRGDVEHLGKLLGRRDFLAKEARRARPAQVAAPDLDRVEPAPRREPVDLAFDRIAHLVRAKAAEGAAGAVVGIGEPATGADVRDPIGAGGVFHRGFQHAGRQRGIGAAVGQRLDLLRHQPPLGVAAGAHADPERVALGAGKHAFGAAQMQAHRSARLQREKRQRRLHRQLVLAAEGAAGRRGDDADLVLGQGEDAGKLHPVARAMLAARADDHALALGRGPAPLRLHETVHLARRDIGVLDHMHRGGKARGEVAAAQPDLGHQIARGMDGLGAGGKRRLHVLDKGERAIVDANERQRALGGLGIDRRHRGDRVAEVAHPVGTQRRLVLEQDAEGVHPGHVAMGDDGAHAGQGLGRGGVDRKDLGMGMGGTQDAADKHPLGPHIGHVGERAAHLGRHVLAHVPALATGGAAQFRQVGLRRGGRAGACGAGERRQPDQPRDQRVRGDAPPVAGAAEGAVGGGDLGLDPFPQHLAVERGERLAQQPALGLGQARGGDRAATDGEPHRGDAVILEAERSRRGDDRGAEARAQPGLAPDLVCERRDRDRQHQPFGPGEPVGERAGAVSGPDLRIKRKKGRKKAPRPPADGATERRQTANVRSGDIGRRRAQKRHIAPTQQLEIGSRTNPASRNSFRQKGADGDQIRRHRLAGRGIEAKGGAARHRTRPRGDAGERLVEGGGAGDAHSAAIAAGSAVVPKVSPFSFSQRR